MRSQLLSVAIIAVSPACVDSSVTEETEEGSRYTSPGCEHLDHSPCSIDIERCQTRLLELAACRRGSEAGALPPISSITPAEYRAWLQAIVGDEPVPDPNPFAQALEQLGLLAPGALELEQSIERQVQSVAAFYDHELKEIVMIAHEGSTDPEFASRVLVHEFVHALQDRDVDLQGFFEEHATSPDHFLATRAVVEGEARLHDSRVAAAMNEIDPAGVNWTLHYQEAVHRMEEVTLADESPYLAGGGLFPYAWGARFMHFVWDDAGSMGVLEQFASPPTSSWAVLASEEGLVTDTLPKIEVTLPSAPDDLIPFAEGEEMGAFNLFLFLGVWGPADEARAGAKAWRGDGLWIYQESVNPELSMLVWRVVFADEQAAAAALEAGPDWGNQWVRRSGSQVTWVRHQNGRILDFMWEP